MTAPTTVFTDLATDCVEFARLLDAVPAERWDDPTPAPGWTIRHQVAHLSSVFAMARLAAAEPDRFRAFVQRLSSGFDADVDAALRPYFDEPSAMRTRWRKEADQATEALAAVPADTLVPWLVRPLPSGVLAAAGMMEMFAHGQDVADRIGLAPVRTDRLRHIVGFAVHTWDFGYQSRDETPPSTPFRFEITGPSGAVWSFGPTEGQLISGPAVDFCMLVTRRRHHGDLAVRAVGPDAEHWLSIAQAYRGPAGEGRKQGQFPVPVK